MDKEREVDVEQTIPTEVEEDTEVKVSDTEIKDSEAEEIIDEVEDSDEELTLSEVLKRPDVKEFLKKVRQQEKAKLYDALDKKETKIKELQDKIDTLERTVASYKEGKDTTIADLKVEIDGLKTKLESSEKARAEKELELYREKSIQNVRDNGQDLIEDLVRGDSKEEIDSSIEVAKAKYDEIVARATAKKEKKVTPKPVAPPQDTGARKLTMDEIMNMSPEEYAKHRAEVKKMIK